MPEPSDPLSERLAAAPGLPTLLSEARATWLARTENDAAAVTEAPADRDVDAARGDSPVDGRAKPPVRVRPSTPQWRAFEDAFPTFYQFTNRPRA
jgi:hypothetical protein